MSSIYGSNIFSSINESVLNINIFESIDTKSLWNEIVNETSFAEGMFAGILGESAIDYVNEKVNFSKFKDVVVKFLNGIKEFFNKVKDTIIKKFNEFKQNINWKVKKNLFLKLYNEIDKDFKKNNLDLYNYLYKRVTEENKTIEHEKTHVYSIKSFSATIEVSKYPVNCKIDDLFNKYLNKGAMGLFDKKEKLVEKSKNITKDMIIDEFCNVLGIYNVLDDFTEFRRRFITDDLTKEIIDKLDSYKESYQYLKQPSKYSFSHIVLQYEKIIPTALKFMQNYINQLNECTKLIDDIIKRAQYQQDKNDGKEVETNLNYLFDTNTYNLSYFTDIMKPAFTDCIKISNKIVWFYQDFAVNVLFASVKDMVRILTKCKNDLKSGEAKKFMNENE